LSSVPCLHTADEQQQFMCELDAWVARADPSRDEIATRLNGI
jgi:hypothetical protein